MDKARQLNKNYVAKQFLTSSGFSIGQLVWLHNPAVPSGMSKKLACPWYGPYTVTSPVNYAIRLFDGSSQPKVVHQVQLSHYELIINNQFTVI